MQCFIAIMLLLSLTSSVAAMMGGGSVGTLSNGLTANSVNPSHMADADHGGFTYLDNIVYIDALRAGDAFPVAPALYDMFWLLTDSTTAACEAGTGAERTACIWNGDNWERAVSERDTLQSVVTRGAAVTSATVSTPVKIGGSTHSWHFYQDGAGALKQRACTNDGTTCTTFDKTLEAGSDWNLVNESGVTCGTFDSVTMEWSANYSSGCIPNLVTGPSVGGGLANVDGSSGRLLGLEGCSPGYYLRRKWDGTAWECWPSNRHTPAVPTGPTHTMLDSDCGSTIGNTTAATLTVNVLADPTGCTMCFFAETAQAIKLEPDGSDNFIVNGLTPAAGDSITLAEAIGNNVCIQGKNATTWWVFLGTGAVTDTN